MEKQHRTLLPGLAKRAVTAVKASALAAQAMPGRSLPSTRGNAVATTSACRFGQNINGTFLGPRSAACASHGTAQPQHSSTGEIQQPVTPLCSMEQETVAAGAD